MKFIKEQIKILRDEKKKIVALSKEQEKSYKKCLKELNLKDGTTPAEYLWEYLFLSDISVKEFQESLDKALKSGNTGNCDAGCGCKH